MSAAMLLSELLPDVAGVPADLVITGLVQDSRAVQPGDAFVAIGPVANDMSVHGLRFAQRAQAAGAAAILFEPPAPDGLPAPAGAIAVPHLQARIGAIADRFHGQPSRAMTTVGVTGTNGKTSTVQLLTQAWARCGVRSGSIGTLGAGLYGHTVPTGFTTPLVLQLHALLASLRDDGAQAVAMEVSSHALDQGRVDGVHFDVAVFTNLTRDHLDYHGDMDAYGNAKARLFAWPGLQSAVVNLDDAFGRALCASLPASTHAIGLSSQGAQADVRAENISLDSDGLAFDLVIGDARFAVQSALLGRFNVDNLLAVAGTLHALGEAPATIARTLTQLQPVAGRMNRLGGNLGQPLVVIDYAHTPDALEQALTSLRAHVRGRLVCVFGCGGERDRGKRPQMAAIAERLADVVIVTDDNPRSESGDTIVAEILSGFERPAQVIVERDRAAAIARAVQHAGETDSVLVAGKGHELYQEIDGVRHPFDDTQVAAAALARAWPERRA
ncbi:UDP-N-acetylmuramoyl-L-alanyl-D-glutamate--2,6-diaminopimelate ligase [Cognatiluteimonas profundi]|uniref:UDP-N-acetylmuramoyl-L-alanyl-D-glutamate--2, 6-diaminopimelate ligase n=1 Tax=Cognatiluteimonas profundi TaxID=2594501 RepID=UPI00131E4CDD|nr:UDP-N-acetylmuramoyl-L-alanyl-D-glutamate--2,6-diaminopimelate ligase [Lysobacter profundi]